MQITALSMYRSAFASPSRLRTAPALLGLGSWFLGLVAAAAPLRIPIELKLYATAVLLLSPLAVAVYAYDKRLAIVHGGRTFAQGARRVDESALHMLALFGGWPGALVGQEFFRHKTSKPAFRIATWGIIAVQIIIVVLVVYLTRTAP